MPGRRGGGEMLVVVKVVFLCLFAAVSWTCVRMEGGEREGKGEGERGVNERRSADERVFVLLACFLQPHRLFFISVIARF